MQLTRARRAGTAALAGGVGAVLGALWPSDWVFLLAAGATATLAWAVWELGRGAHVDRDPLRQAGAAIASLGLVVASGGFVVALSAALTDRSEIVFAALSSAVAAGIYILLPIGLLALGSRVVRWKELSTTGRALPLVMGFCGFIAIPATVLISLPGFAPGRLASLLVILREMVLIGWIPLGAALRRARPAEDR